MYQCTWIAAIDAICTLSPVVLAGLWASASIPVGYVLIGVSAWMFVPMVVEQLFVTLSRPSDRKASVLAQLGDGRAPVFFSSAYDITAGGLERLHPFDSTKYSKIVRLLGQRGLLPEAAVLAPRPLDPVEVAFLHGRRYVASLHSALAVSAVVELPVCFLPSAVLRARLLNPFLHQAGGTCDAVHAAAMCGWAINVGGGFHHASRGRAHGFCAFADITGAVRQLQAGYPALARRILIIDLDAHQGDGYARDLAPETEIGEHASSTAGGGSSRVRIIDAFHHGIFPNDAEAAAVVATRIRLTPDMEDGEHLAEYARALRAAREWDPTFVIYNAGTDTLEGDPLGGLAMSPAGIVERDEMVWTFARASHPVPIVHLLSGGYQAHTATVIADSLANLHHKLGLFSATDSGPN